MVEVYMDPGGTGVTITELYAWIAGDLEDEGVIAWTSPDGLIVPLVGSDMARVESYRRFAQNAHRNTGQPVRLVRFSERTVLENL